MIYSPRDIKVIAVDHNPILLEGIAVLIRHQRDMRLIGVGSSAEEAVTLHLQQRPDVTVLDLELPNASAPVAIERILTVDRRAKLIGLTTYEFDKSRAEALSSGVIAVVTKDRIGEDLAPLIRRCHSAPQP